MMRSYKNEKPKTFELVGNGNYLYHWDIKEETVQVPPMNDGEETTQRTQFSYLEAVIHGEPTYDKCVEAVIRKSYSQDVELSLINKYNSYQYGVISDKDAIAEYESYLLFIASTKEMVRKDFEMDIPEQSIDKPRIFDILRLMAMSINTMNLTDPQALSVKSLYPAWKDKIGEEVDVNFKMKYNNKLWKVLQRHTVQEQFKPGTGTESLYFEIDETHAGTIDDPIPYNGNMVLENGKYYIQDNVKYKCTRDTGIPVYHPLKDLVGQYVELIS